MPIAQDVKNLTENLEVSYGERMSWLSGLRKDTRQMMSQFQREHKSATESLDAFLGESESVRMAEFKKMLVAIQSRQSEREKEVATLLKRFGGEFRDLTAQFKDLATQLKTFLSGSETKRLEEFKGMAADIKSKQRAREKEVADLLVAYQKDNGEARGHWQNLAKIMVAKRRSKRVPVTVVPKEAEVPKGVEKKAEEAFEEGDLKARTLKVIESHPQGIRLRKIADKLNVAHIRLGKLVKELIEEGKVEKRDSLYFSIS